MKWNLEKIYQLAKIKRLSSELDSSIEQTVYFIDQIHQVDVDNIEPMHHPLELSQTCRLDEVTETDHHQTYQQNAPVVDESFYLVPQVID